MSAYKVIKTHYDGGANVFALTDPRLFFILVMKDIPYTQASGTSDMAKGISIALFRFPGGTHIYPCPAYLTLSNPESTFSPGALKHFIGFKIAQCDALSHCNSLKVDAQSYQLSSKTFLIIY
jgi:hypothetical protein